MAQIPPKMLKALVKLLKTDRLPNSLYSHYLIPMTAPQTRSNTIQGVVFLCCFIFQHAFG